MLSGRKKEITTEKTNKRSPLVLLSELVNECRRLFLSSAKLAGIKIKKKNGTYANCLFPPLKLHVVFNESYTWFRLPMVTSRR